MNRQNLIRAGAVVGMAVVVLAGCSGDGDRTPASSAATSPTSVTTAATSATTATTATTASTTATTAATPATTAATARSLPAPGPGAAPAETFLLASVESGDAACYLQVKNGSGTKSLAADFELCPGGTNDATPLVGRKVTLERRSQAIMADSCNGDPECTETKTVDLVIRVKPVR